MEKLSKKNGMKILPWTWTVFLTNQENFFVTPFSLQSLRHRCLFVKMKGITDGMYIYFHLSEEERSLMSFSDQTYFYGAFNSVTVHQVRSFGNLRELTGVERNRFTRVIKDQLDVKNVKDKVSNNIKKANQEEVLQLLQGGKFYRFEALNYSCHVYERG